MTLAFSKMHGLGNDFVVFDAVNQRVVLDETQLRAIADRRFGIGCDQILLVEPARRAGNEFYYRIFNADGGEVEQCGNGARCFARFVHDKGLTDSREIPVGTAAGDIRLYLEDDGLVRVNMGRPYLKPAEIPFQAAEQALHYSLDVDGRRLDIGAVSMGNPHAVLLVDDVATAPVESLGPQIERHARFPRRANVGFMAVRDRTAIDLRVFGGRRRAPARAARRARGCAAARRNACDKLVRKLPAGVDDRTGGRSIQRHPRSRQSGARVIPDAASHASGKVGT